MELNIIFTAYLDTVDSNKNIINHRRQEQVCTSEDDTLVLFRTKYLHLTGRRDRRGSDWYCNLPLELITFSQVFPDIQDLSWNMWSSVYNGSFPSSATCAGLLLSSDQMKEEKGVYTHSQGQTGKSTYPDDSIQLGHCHLLGSLNSLSHLLLMLQDTNTQFAVRMEVLQNYSFLSSKNKK